MDTHEDLTFIYFNGPTTSTLVPGTKESFVSLVTNLNNKNIVSEQRCFLQYSNLTSGNCYLDFENKNKKMVWRLF